ncbi:LysR family transcriptional regulator [Oceanibium sediminis]|uniref:LysR family transcriptional regulator n=1 Tax=Oceanibium sediminis TaxID=2026339 RepID=UPI000DD2C1A2|nr:LysR family transcriptional regulator [Oceanibium sediminis]
MARPDQAATVARQLDWNLLRTFVVLSESASVSDAAGRLGLKQPSVSAALKRLEMVLGKQLIDRGPGRFALTEAGEMLRREAMEINGQVLRLATLMRDVTDEVTGDVRIALASHVVCPLLDDALGDFHRTHPKATLSIAVHSSIDAIDAVASGRAAFAVALVRNHSPKLEYARLYRERFGLFCGPNHPLFGRPGLKPEDLAGFTAVSFDTDRLQDVLRQVALLRARVNLSDQIVGTSSALEEVRRMIIAGLGIGALPVHVAARDVRDGLLWPLPPHENLPAVDVYLTHNPKARLNRAEAALLGMVLKRIADVPMAERTY